MPDLNVAVVVENIGIVRKDHKTLPFRIEDWNGDPVDLTGGSAQLIAKLNKTDADGSAKITKLISTTPDAQGQIDNPTGADGNPQMFFKLLPADTSALDLAIENVKYPYWVSVKVGGEYTTTTKGHLLIEIEGSAKTYA